MSLYIPRRHAGVTLNFLLLSSRAAKRVKRGSLRLRRHLADVELARADLGADGVRLAVGLGDRALHHVVRCGDDDVAVVVPQLVRDFSRRDVVDLLVERTRGRDGLAPGGAGDRPSVERLAEQLGGLALGHGAAEVERDLVTDVDEVHQRDALQVRSRGLRDGRSAVRSRRLRTRDVRAHVHRRRRRSRALAGDLDVHVGTCHRLVDHRQVLLQHQLDVATAPEARSHEGSDLDVGAAGERCLALAVLLDVATAGARLQLIEDDD